MNAQTLDFNAARNRRERELEDARQKGWLEARRYYQFEHEPESHQALFWIGTGFGIFMTLMTLAIVRTL